MERRIVNLALGAMVLGTMLPAAARADAVLLRRGDVIPVVVEDGLDVSQHHRGDHFWVRIKDSNDLPRGTRLVGRIRDLHRSRGHEPGYADIDFLAVVLPDGDRIDIDAVAVSMDSVRRTEDGHFEGAANGHSKRDVVLAGTLGGTVLGAIMHRPGEGAVLGTLAGTILAKTNALHTDPDVVLDRNATIGVLFQRDVEIRTDRDDRRPRYDRIEYRGHEVNFGDECRPFRDGEVLMVPLNDCARQLELRVREDGPRGFSVEDDNCSLRIEQDSRECRLNGRRERLSHPVIVRNGIVYVPLDILGQMKGRLVTVNGTKP